MKKLVSDKIAAFQISTVLLLAASVSLGGGAILPRALADKPIDQRAAEKPKDKGDKDQPLPAPQVSAEYMKWRDLILPDEKELTWQTIGWRPRFWPGVLEAQAKDKPILLLLMNGHPLGCT